MDKILEPEILRDLLRDLLRPLYRQVDTKEPLSSYRAFLLLVVNVVEIFCEAGVKKTILFITPTPSLVLARPYPTLFGNKTR